MADLKIEQVLQTAGSYVDDIFTDGPYLLWGESLVLRKNIFAFLKKVTDIDKNIKITENQQKQRTDLEHKITTILKAISKLNFHRFELGQRNTMVHKVLNPYASLLNSIQLQAY